MNKEYPFIYGAQYYRAPTPHKDRWAEDLKAMKNAGFSDVKYWAQWRWTCRKEGEYYFDDLDTLMNLAQEIGLRVTINVICDVCPSYIYKKYPDCRPVDIHGVTLPETEVSCRQIGGYPGPCYNHGEAFKERMDFIKVLVERYANHPAMFMWDMWNEPEHNLKMRAPKFDNIFCFCDNCKRAFGSWLEEKYKNIENLNDIWGRCYNDFSEIELPRTGETIGDFTDYRLFALDTMAKEADARVLLAKSIDKNHVVYLHPVPNTGDCFNSLTGVDDFKMSRNCDCFAGTTNGFPTQPLQTVSSAKGKVAYNVESHLRYGSAAMYPKELGADDFLNVFIPQVGLGIKGFLHWQFDGETLGVESPAWGLNGNDISLNGAKVAGEKLRNFFDKGLLSAYPKPAEIAIYKSSSNDLVQFCINQNMDDLINATNAYTKAFYALNGNISYVNDEEVINGLDENIKVLVMPYVYALTPKIAKAIYDFVEKGGILLTDAHLGAYNCDTNRIAMGMGCGISELFGIKEVHVTHACHLPKENNIVKNHKAEEESDVSKAMKSFGNVGGDEFLVQAGNVNLLGFKRYAEYTSENSEVLGIFNDKPVIIKKQVGKGFIIAMGSLFATAFENRYINPTGYWQDAPNDMFSENKEGDFKTFLYNILKDYVNISYENLGVRRDILTDDKGKNYYAFTNLTDKEMSFDFDFKKPVCECRGEEISGKKHINLKPHEALLFGEI